MMENLNFLINLLIGGGFYKGLEFIYKILIGKKKTALEENAQEHSQLIEIIEQLRTENNRMEAIAAKKETRIEELEIEIDLGKAECKEKIGQLEISCVDLIDRANDFQQETNSLKAEIEFLRAKLDKLEP